MYYKMYIKYKIRKVLEAFIFTDFYMSLINVNAF